jgi:hypothetical protein
MCGIVGNVTKRQWGFDNFDLDWFKQMLVCDTIRGVDGTGMFVAGRNKHVLWGKVATHPFRLFQFQETGQMFAYALGQGRVVVTIARPLPGRSRTRTRTPSSRITSHWSTMASSGTQGSSSRPKWIRK